MLYRRQSRFFFNVISETEVFFDVISEAEQRWLVQAWHSFGFTLHGFILSDASIKGFILSDALMHCFILPQCIASYWCINAMLHITSRHGFILMHQCNDSHWCLYSQYICTASYWCINCNASYCINALFHTNALHWCTGDQNGLMHKTPNCFKAMLQCNELQRWCTSDPVLMHNALHISFAPD